MRSGLEKQPSNTQLEYSLTVFGWFDRARASKCLKFAAIADVMRSMTQTKAIRAIVTVLSAALALLLSGCGEEEGPNSTRYWNVVMAGGTTAGLTITFGNGVSASQGGIITGGTTAGWGHHQYNLFASGGLINGGLSTCRLTNAGHTVVIPGQYSGSIPLEQACAGGLLSNLQISLGSTAASILDSTRAVNVRAGSSVSGTIQAPGNAGASTGNIYY
jgi:hypothetical protein